LGQPPEWFDRLRDEAIAALALPDVQITCSWDGFAPDTWRVSLSRDFELYARTTQRGACSIRRVADDVEIARLPELGELAGAEFRPGGLLTVGGESSHRLQLWDLSGPEPVCRLNEGNVSGTDFTPDGRLMVLGDTGGALRVYATDTGACTHRLAPTGITKEPRIRVHPTKPFVAISSYRSNMLQVRDLQSGAVLVSLTLPWRGSNQCDWASDGRTLVVSDGDGSRIHLYAFEPSAPGLRLIRALRTPDNDGGPTPQFNPAGDRLASRGWSGRVYLFDVPTGRLLFSTPALPLAAWPDLLFDPSGRRLAAARVGPQEEQVGLWSVADAREYRALVYDGGRRRFPQVALPAVRPDGRLAAQGLTDGVALWDLETGRQLAFVAVPGGGNVGFDGAGNLLLASRAGCFRWPVQADATQPGRLAVGPAERLPLPPGQYAITGSRDGQVIAEATYGGGGWVMHRDAPQPRRLEPYPGLTYASVSPDGRLVAFGLNLTHVNVYEAATGRRVWQSPADRHCWCRFSPDGLWLMTANDGGRAYRVDTWEPGPRLGPGTPWDVSPDGRLVVVGLSDGVYRLVERSTGREVARLEDPEQVAAPAVFTPDGTRLVIGGSDGLRVWDLRRIRAELAPLGLDWEAPPYPEAAGAGPEPLEVRVIDDGLIDPKSRP
jgi:WD40 repeat protein